MARVYASELADQKPKGRVYLSDLRGETSPAEGFARGVINSPTRVVQGLEAAASYGRRTPISIGGSALASVTEPLANRIAPPAEGGPAYVTEQIGEQALPGAIGAAVGGYMGGPLAAVGEAALAGTTPVVGAGVRALGGGDKAAVLAELGYNTLAPGLMLRSLYGYRGPMQPALHELRARVGARSLVPTDPMGGGRFHEKAADALLRSQRGVTDPRMSQTSESVLRDIAPNFENLAIRKAQVDPRFNRDIGGQKMLSGDLYDERVSSIVGQTEPMTTINRTFKSVVNSERQAAGNLFEQLALKGEPPATDTYIEKALQRVESEAGVANRDTLPHKQIAELRGFNGKIPWDEMQRIRSRLGAIVEAGRSPSASPAARLRKQWAEQIRDGIDETIENTASLANDYPDAIAAWKRYKTVFNRKSKAYKALDSQSNSRRAVAEILDGRDGVTEAIRVREMFANNPAALEDFKGVVLSETLMPTNPNATPKSIQRTYANRRQAMEQLWSPDQIAIYDEMVSEGIETAAGKAGRRGMNYGAGSSTVTMPTRGGFLGWAMKQAGNFLTGHDLTANRAMERLLMNPRELEPVLRSWRFGNTRDAARLLGLAMMKTVARSVLNTSTDMAIEQPLPAVGGER